MSYIIVWRHRHRDPHLGTDTHDFLESYSTYEQAKQHAEETVEHEGPKSPWYFDYAIYQEAED
jgi:hypothetical protein